MPDIEKALILKLDSFSTKVASRDLRLVDELWGVGDFVMVGSESGEIFRTRDELDAKLRSVFSSPATFVFT